MGDIGLSALYDEKIALMREMLRVTSIVSIEGTDPKKYDDEAEDYIALMEKRKGFLDKILLIDEKIEACGIQADDAIAARKAEISEIAKELLLLDEKNAEISVKLMSFVKKSIKEINNGKNLNNRYQNNDYQGGTTFDQKK